MFLPQKRKKLSQHYNGLGMTTHLFLYLVNANLDRSLSPPAMTYKVSACYQEKVYKVVAGVGGCLLGLVSGWFGSFSSPSSTCANLSFHQFLPSWKVGVKPIQQVARIGFSILHKLSDWAFLRL